MRFRGISRTMKYAAIQGSYWLSNCAIYCFSTVYLLENRISMKDIGLIITLVNVLSVAVQFYSSALIRKSGGKITLKLTACVITGVSLASAAALYFTAGNIPSVLFVALLFSVTVIMNTALQPLISSIAMECVNYGERLNFSAARGFGSISYAAAAYFLGGIIAKSGSGFLPVLYVLFGSFLLLGIWFFKVPQIVAEPHLKEETGEKQSFAAFLLANPHFLMLLLGIMFITLCSRMTGTYLIKIVENIGGDSSHMGIAVAISAGSEFPTMLYFNRIARRFKCSTLLKASGVFFTIKAFLIALSGHMWMLYLSNGMQILSFALLLPSMVYYINQIMSEKNRVMGQVSGVTAMTLGDILGSLIIGMLPNGGTIPLVMTIAVAFCAAGCVLVILFTKPVEIQLNGF